MKNRTVRIALAIAAVVPLTLAVSACAPPGQAASGQASAGTGPIRIAVIDAQSGQASAFGDYEYKGAKLAFDAANAKGGIDGRKVELTVYDTQGDPTTATNLARKAATDGAVAVIGPALSAPALAALPIFDQEKIPFITSATSPKMAQTGSKFLFLNSPESTSFDATLAKYIDGKFSSIALISNNGAYGAGEHDAFLSDLKAMGVTPVADQVITPDQKDFTSALTRIQQAHPQALFIGTEDVQAGLIVKQARQAGIHATIIGAVGVSSANYVKTAGVDAAAGSIASTPYLGNDESAASQKFAQEYKAAYGQDGQFFSAKAYDGAQILIQALTSSHVATGAALADAIRATSYTGLVGQFHFDENGVGVHETKIGIMKNGALVPASEK